MLFFNFIYIFDISNKTIICCTLNSILIVTCNYDYITSIIFSLLRRNGKKPIHLKPLLVLN